MNRSLNILLFLLIFASTTSIFASTEINENNRVSNSVSKDVQVTLDKNNFNVTRDYSEYVNIFGKNFEDTLNKLDKNGHWLDAGAGEGYAINGYILPVEVDSKEAELFKQEAMGMCSSFGSSLMYERFMAEQKEKMDKINELVKKKDKAKVTLVSYKISKDRLKKLNEITSGVGVSIFEGRFFEDIADKDIISQNGKVNLITDLYGVVAYTDRLSTALNKYFNLLVPGGEAYIYLGTPSHMRRYYDTLYTHSVTLKNGNTVDLIEWMKISLADCFNVELINESFTMKLTKKDVKKCTIPDLEFKEYIEVYPAPQPRLFKEKIDGVLDV